MDSIYLACFIRDRYHCRHCNSTIGLHPHHVVFRSQLGGDKLNNLLTLCFICHNAVHNKNLIIEVIGTLEDNLEVEFIRKNGWKP